MYANENFWKIYMCFLPRCNRVTRAHTHRKIKRGVFFVDNHTYIIRIYDKKYMNCLLKEEHLNDTRCTSNPSGSPDLSTSLANV